ncbi:hypothetical protein DCE79_10665 [Lysinibacillus sp. 2017]|uniref:hypothetical protein n=1 Tax=unclassified Lysinibacillus TaxID=2636778 RepID=UPI000D527A13|nr:MULTISPECIES: hypothetical protein [unclassified Lysinibacillus]AWE07817.1 hypothetical protein DCE79_10665 [Lysinibacillus sp. 2017]TGN32290.1 hypothetical protein E4L99_15705 [Lysinibacillus sp. S2017]
MKKILILIIAISLFAVLSKAIATTNNYDEIAKSDKVGVTIYAKKMNGLYTDFKIDFQGSLFSKPYWINTTSPTWSPEIIYEDISQDGKKELVIILTKGTGTGVLEREVHVFQMQQQKSEKTQSMMPVEVPVDDPIAILLKNVKTEITPNKAIVSIGDKKYTIDIKPLGIQPEHLFDDIYFGNRINFEIKNNQLIAKLGGQISPV